MNTGKDSEATRLRIRDGLERSYPDVFTPEATAVLAALAPFN